jgi:hypothetical protein
MTLPLPPPPFPPCSNPPSPLITLLLSSPLFKPLSIGQYRREICIQIFSLPRQFARQSQAHLIVKKIVKPQ